MITRVAPSVLALTTRTEIHAVGVEMGTDPNERRAYAVGLLAYTVAKVAEIHLPCNTANCLPCNMFGLAVATIVALDTDKEPLR